MSKYSSVNNRGSNGAEAIFELKTVLKSAGWTVQKSSDGSTYNASGDQISHASSGAGGMENSSAWFVIRDPGDSHEWCFQRGTTNLVWRVKISPLDQFTGGSPDATTVPSATDEQEVHGSGTDASPTFATLFLGDGTFFWHVIAQSTAVGTTVPVYGFWSFSTTQVTGADYTLICQDPLDPDSLVDLQGTRANPTLGDPDPVVYICGYSPNIAHVYTGSGSFGTVVTSGFAYQRYNYDDEEWTDDMMISFVIGYYSSVRHFAAPANTEGLGTNPHNGKDDLMPVVYAKPITLCSTGIGLKGVSKYLRQRAIYKHYPSVINLATDAKVYLGDLVFPWEDNTLPLL
jgi:hypothetical protein